MSPGLTASLALLLQLVGLDMLPGDLQAPALLPHAQLLHCSCLVTKFTQSSPRPHQHAGDVRCAAAAAKSAAANSLADSLSTLHPCKKRFSTCFPLLRCIQVCAVQRTQPAPATGSSRYIASVRSVHVFRFSAHTCIWSPRPDASCTAAQQ